MKAEPWLYNSLELVKPRLNDAFGLLTTLETVLEAQCSHELENSAYQTVNYLLLSCGTLEHQTGPLELPHEPRLMKRDVVEPLTCRSVLHIQAPWHLATSLINEDEESSPHRTS